jgi:cell division septation protein DedD
MFVACLTAAPAAADVASGVQAWQAGNYPRALSEWRPLANRGDAEAQFHMGQAYRSGLGVSADAGIARSWYQKAAQQGHRQAQAELGLLLYQTGERKNSIYWLRKAAERDHPRAQFVLGLAHLNGDGVARDLPRAKVLMRRAHAGGLARAAAVQNEIDRRMSLANRAKSDSTADRTADEAAPASADLPRLALGPGATTDLRLLTPQAAPAPRPAPPADGVATRPPARPAPAIAPAAPAPLPASPTKAVATGPAAAPAPAPAATSAPSSNEGWRVQLGAYGNETEARSRWTAIAGRIKALSGLTPSFERYGRFTRLRVGPVGGKLDANRLCASAKASGQDCFVVSP